MAKPLGFLDYLKAAFHVSPRVPALGNLPLNYLAVAAFAVLGLANPGFWFLGAALETGYLVTMATNPRFQRVVQGQALADERKTVEARRQELLDRLDIDDRKRYLALENRCGWILFGGGPLVAGGLSQGPISRQDFDQLLEIFFRLLSAREMLIHDARQPGLRKDLQQQRERIASKLKDGGIDEQLRRTLESTKGLLDRRVQILETADAKLQYVEAEMDRLEQQVALIAQEASSALRDPQALSRRIDAMTQGLGETTKWIRDLQGPLSEAEAGLEAPAPPPPPRRESETA
jgi:hypothetical protein